MSTRSTVAVEKPDIGFVGGTLLAIGRRSDKPWLVKACSAYVEVLRNTPLLVQVFLVFFGLASLGTGMWCCARRWKRSTPPSPVSLCC